MFNHLPRSPMLNPNSGDMAIGGSQAIEFNRIEDHRRRRDEVETLEEKVDRLSLVCEAMWELMCDAGYTTAHLQAKVEQLDASDGTVDQKRTRIPLDCACGAKVPIHAKSCVFCSLPAPTRPAFDAV